MNIDQAFTQAEIAKKLSTKGADIVRALKGYITAEFADHIKILGTSTNQRLYVDFYGVLLLFRIEIVWGRTMLSSISAYALSENPTKETPLGVSFRYDQLGNVEQTLTENEYPAYFLQKVMTLLYDGNSVLKP